MVPADTVVADLWLIVTADELAGAGELVLRISVITKIPTRGKDCKCNGIGILHTCTTLIVNFHLYFLLLVFILQFFLQILPGFSCIFSFLLST